MSSRSCVLTADDCSRDLLVHFGAEINYLGPSFSILKSFLKNFWRKWMDVFLLVLFFLDGRFWQLIQTLTWWRILRATIGFNLTHHGSKNLYLFLILYLQRPAFSTALISYFTLFFHGYVGKGPLRLLWSTCLASRTIADDSRWVMNSRLLRNWRRTQF